MLYQKQLQYFKEALERGRLSHAFCLVGPEGVGKLHLAQEWIEILNQLNPEERAQNFSNGHPDIFIIKPGVRSSLRLSTRLSRLAWVCSPGSM